LEMLMYPNPASDFVQLRLAEPGINEYRIEIYDQVGKLIKQEIWNGNEEIKNITLSSIKSGIYFIRLKDEDGLTRSLKKLVIIKR
jgi:type IX secretion system substrate protein